MCLAIMDMCAEYIKYAHEMLREDKVGYRLNIYLMFSLLNHNLEKDL